MFNIIFNTYAGNNFISYRCNKLLNKLKILFINVDYKIYIIKNEFDCKQSIKEIISSTTHTDNIYLVIVGGDGTLNTVINNIDNLNNFIIGYIPSGTGNDFARSVGLLKYNIDEIVNKILNMDKIVYVDVGYVILNNCNKKRFIVSSGIGCEADVCCEINNNIQTKRIFNKFGISKLLYLFSLLKIMHKTDVFNAKIHIDNNEFKFKNVFSISIMNVQYEGGGAIFNPYCYCSSNNLGAIVLHKICNFRSLVYIFLKNSIRKYVYCKNNVFKKNCTNLVIDVNRELNIHIDGQTISNVKHMEAHLEESKLKFII